jgi:uncharacterized protein
MRMPLYSLKVNLKREFLMKKSLIALSLVTLMTAAHAQTLNRQISMTGTSKITAQTSQAYVTAGAITTGKTAREASDKNATIMTSVLNGLKDIGIDPKDVVSTDISLRPVIEYSTRNIPRVVGYDATHTLSITFKDMGKLGDGLDKIVSAGANSIGEVTLTAPLSEEKQEEARVNAVKDARRKAETLVTAAGGKLGRVISISLQGYNAPRAARTMMADSMSKSASTPIAAGDLTGDVSVNVTFEIVD